jgi:parvulin-like peptidyl-prolyl isomerase
MGKRAGALAVAGALVGCLGMPAVLGAAAPAGTGGDREVARVNGSAIRRADLEGYLSLKARDRSRPLGPEQVRRRLDEMVRAEVLYLEALRTGVDRDPGVRQALRQIVVQKLLERAVDLPVAARAVGEDELRAFYEGHVGEYNRPAQVRLAEIFVAAPETGDAAARERGREKAEGILARALALQDPRFGFGELVAAESDKPVGHAAGDTGFFDRQGQPVGIASSLAEAAFRIGRTGEIAREVIGTPAGWHVVMLVGRRDALRRELADREVRAEIEERIRTEERSRRHDELVKDLMAKAEIRIEEDALRELSPPAVRGEGGGGASPRGASPESGSPPGIPEERR